MAPARTAAAARPSHFLRTEANRAATVPTPWSRRRTREHGKPYVLSSCEGVSVISRERGVSLHAHKTHVKTRANARKRKTRSGFAECQPSLLRPQLVQEPHHVIRGEL